MADKIAIIGLIATVAVAVWQIYETRIAQRRKDTLALITEWRDGESRLFRMLESLKKIEGLDRFADSNSQGKDAQWMNARKTLIDLVNHFELISIGVDSGIYDEEIVVKVMRTLIVRNYAELARFIAACRRAHDQPTFGAHFERFAKKLGARDS